MSIRRITFAFPAVISYNKATCGAFEKLRSDLGYIKNIQIEVRFHGPNSLLGTLQNCGVPIFVLEIVPIEYIMLTIYRENADALRIEFHKSLRIIFEQTIKSTNMLILF